MCQEVEGFGQTRSCFLPQTRIKIVVVRLVKYLVKRSKHHEQRDNARWKNANGAKSR